MPDSAETIKNNFRIKNTVSVLTPEEKEQLENEIVEQLYKLFIGK